MSGYIKDIHVLNCWAFKDRKFDLDGKRHLVLVGPNGSGKTTILEALMRYLDDPLWTGVHGDSSRLEKTTKNSAVVVPTLEVKAAVRSPVILFPAMRTFQGQPVDGPHALETNPARRRNRTQFVQYLVNRRTEQAYAREDNDQTTADTISNWFEELEKQLSKLLGEPLTLKFTRSPKFAYSLVHADDRESPFQNLPSGYGSVIDMFSRVLMDLDEKQRSAEDPILLLIDEPEIHLHPRLQLTLLPTLAKLIPGAQIIAATHSPLVAASLSDAAVFNLETGERVKTFGLDPNAALLRVFDAALQPSEVKDLMTTVANEIDRDPTAAQGPLNRLKEILGADHDEVVRLSTLMSLLEVEEDAADQ